MEPRNDRKIRLQFMNAYLEALVGHDPTRLALSRDVKATENGTSIRLGHGIWQTIRTIMVRKTFLDDTTNQAGFWGVIEEKDGEKAIFALRLKIEDNAITEIETLVSRKGCHPLFSPDTFTIKPFWDTPIPVSRQLSRKELVDIADSYFVGIEAADASLVEFHPDCQRRENGIQTTNSPGLLKFSAPGGIPRLDYIKEVRERRYPIVDENHGLVWAMVVFDVPGTDVVDDKLPQGSVQHSLRALPRCLLLYEIFKIEDGLIRDIEAFMTNAPVGASHGWTT